jgi:hypothetical protein
MHTRAKPLVAGVLAAVTLAAMVGTASANSLSFSNQSFRVVWTPIEIRFGVEAAVIRCNLTWEGRLHSTTIGKAPNNLIGYVTRATFGRPCEGGSAWTLNGVEEIEVLRVIPASTLPWHVKYQSFTGTLPNIASIRIDVVDVSFMTRIMEILCLYRSTAASPARFIFQVNGGQLTALTADETAALPRFSGNVFCPTTASLRGAGSVRLLGSTTTLIFVSLI